MCKNCNRLTFFSSLCKDCELKERRKWIKKHTFKYGEKVKVIFEGEPFVKGIVVGFQEDQDDYSAGNFYKVKLPSKNVELYGNWMLEKAK